MDLIQMAKAWGNDSFAAPLPYLEALVQAYGSTSGMVLELGSGLTTCVLDRLSRPDGRRVVCLEQDVQWAARALNATSHVEVRVAPLEQGWYGRHALEGIEDVGLVVLDGPCGSRGRTMECIGDRLRHDCIVLADDARRDRASLEQMAQAHGFAARFERGDGRGIAWMTRQDISHGNELGAPHPKKV